MTQKKNIKLIIAGSRDFNDYELLKTTCDKFYQSFNFQTIVSGTARGADTLGEYYAKERGLYIERYPAEWNKYGKSAGYKRNEIMAQNADALIAFWDGSSKGTKHMIDIANIKNLQVRVIRY